MRAYPKLVATVYTGLVLMLLHQRYVGNDEPLALDRFLYPQQESSYVPSAVSPGGPQATRTGVRGSGTMSGKDTSGPGISSTEAIGLSSVAR